jgi:hypothetical protein
MASAATQLKAQTFVRAVSDLHESLKRADTVDPSSHPQILTTTTEDLARFVERMLAKQDEYRAAKMCSLVDIGYHHTQAGNLATIRTTGLLTRKEQTEKRVKSTTYSGTQYGDGIYTCDNPLTYRNQFGPVGLLVARLKGTPGGGHHATYTKNSLVVLRSSANCAPLVHFTTTAREDLIYKYQNSILSLIDSHFNAASLPRISPHDMLIPYTAPDALGSGLGKMPSGRMKVQRKHVTCSGYPSGTIEIVYCINSGAQKAYHW